MGDRALERLLRRLRRGDEDAFAEVAAMAVDAGRAALVRYRSDSYRLEPSVDDRGQQFGEHMLRERVRRGDDYLVDMVARCTSMQHLSRLLGMKARRWAADRGKPSFAFKLLHRIRELPDRIPDRFVWVIVLRLLGLVGGPLDERPVERDTLAARVAGTPAGRTAIDEFVARQFIGKVALRELIATMLQILGGAADPRPLPDVVLLICGQADTRPLILRDPPDQLDDFDPLRHLPDAECVLHELRADEYAADDFLLLERLNAALAGTEDGGLYAAIAAALEACDVPGEDHAEVLAGVSALLAPGESDE